ncbi:phage tail protein [Vagococcus carniphilus]|uniref:phage tail protein n=1 Tax=Vagococcus carniphilus TaxID=218144 RepID=UPI00288E9971|nr:phage tail protein [Vagococcus carniphilus]MDT2814370.1 phage tail protein [Vagococcus carniphilus]
MSETYGFDKLSIRKLTTKREPDETAKVHVIEGTATEGAPVTMEITGLTKEAVKVWGGDVEYFTIRKGVGAVAANFGLLDVPSAVDQEILGYLEMAEGIDAIGNDSEAPYVAVVAESEDLNSGAPVAFGIVSGTFGKDGFSLATKTDEDFTPEPGEYVLTAVSRKVKIEEKEKQVHVLRAFGDAAVKKMKEAVLGKETTVPEG